MEPKKQDVMWFEFLFDKTGSLLSSHLNTANAEPTALQLIQLFIEKSGSAVFPNGQDHPESSGEVNNKRKRRLLLLAFHVLSNLDWNLNVLETSLPIHVQFILLKELVKQYFKGMQDNNPLPVLSKLEKAAVIPLLLYHRWVLRAIVQQSSSNFCDNKTNDTAQDSKGAKSEASKLLNKLRDEENASVNVLQQAVAWQEDLCLPVLPSLKWTEERQDNSSSSDEVKVGSSEGAQASETDVNKDKATKPVSPGDNEMDTSEAFKKVISSQEIIGQICFDLGVFYFYQENIERAKGLFEICSRVQCPKSSFYTVDKRRLSGYYTACCSLLHYPVRDELVSHQSLMSQMEQCKYDGYKNLVVLLVKDNVEQEVPYSYRNSLEADVIRLMKENRLSIRVEKTLVWQVCCCNIIGCLLAGRSVDPDSWKKLENSTKEQFELFIRFCRESVAMLPKKEKDDTKNPKLMQLGNTIESLVVGSHAAERFEILIKSDAESFINISSLEKTLEKRENDLRKAEIKLTDSTHLAHQAMRNNIQVQISQLEHELQTTTSPSQVPNVLMQLHGLDPDPHKKHAKGHESSIYGTYIQDLKDDILQDLLHVLFSKANQCSQRKDYALAKNFLDFGFQTIQDQRKRYGNTSAFDRMTNFLSQEILLANILMAEENLERVSDDLLWRIKSNVSYTTPDYYPRPHVMEAMIVYLLNIKEWTILTELDGRAAPASMDCKELARVIAGVCLNLTKPQLWRKMAKNMWDSVLRIFTATVQHKRMLPDGTIIDIKRDAGNLPYFVKFISRIKEETCLSLVISCLERMRSLEPTHNEEDKEPSNFAMYSHLWPTSIPSSGNVSFTQIGLALLETIDHSVSVHPFNSAFLKIQGDTFYENENHLNALRCYLQSGAASSDFFVRPVPKSVWDNAAYRKMIACCSAFKAHTQAAVLCQFLEPLDYTLAFSAMKQTARDDASEFYYNCVWDITLLEFTVDIHSKRGEHDKKQIAIQALGQPELNSCNPPEILQNAKRVRNTRFLQILAKQYL